MKLYPWRRIWSDIPHPTSHMRARQRLGWALIAALAVVTLVARSWAVNPTTAVSEKWAVLQATTSEQTLTLDPGRAYILAHNDRDISGVAASDTIYLADNASVDNDDSEGPNKCMLISGRVVQVGPGVTTLKYRLAAGAATSPTFQLLFGPNTMGRY